MKNFVISAGLTAVLALGGITAPQDAQAAGKAEPAPSRDWSFQGVFGTYDRASAQRGFQVYREVCASCHAMNLVSFRNLASLGYSEAQIKAFAAEYEVEDGPNDEGEMFTRTALPSDRYPSPFENANAAKAANNGAYPPDLSLITKARFNGPNYVHAILAGYPEELPPGVEEREGLSYNPYFAGGWLAMAPPLVEDGVEYQDGTKASVDQQAHDVVMFLNWAAEPELEERKQMGLKVILFLIVLTGMLYALKRQIWRDLH